MDSQFKDLDLQSLDFNASTTKGTKLRDLTKVIRISNMPLDCTEYDLLKLARLCPVAQDMFLAKDRITEHFRGIAYIYFRTVKDARRGIEVLDGINFNDSKLRVTFARSK